MRYVGLVFLGLLLWAGQVSAVLLDHERSKFILSSGEILSETYNTSLKRDFEYTLIARIRYDGGLYICTDFVYHGVVRVCCFDETPTD